MTVVAIVPARDRGDSVGATVTALRALGSVDRVVVVDDGSTDHTPDAARAAGAEVLSLTANRGKGGAVLAAVETTPDADVYLLIDADLAATAGEADRLLRPVLEGDADMTVGVLPPAGGRGGFGAVRALAGRGIERATGRRVRAPLSGQRAIRAELLRNLPSADRFGLEVAITIDAARAGARIVEVDVPMDHRHTGRSWRGFAHRAGQGRDIARSLWPRLTSARQRMGVVVVAAVVALVALAYGGATAEPASRPATGPAGTVVVFGIPRLGLDHVGTGLLPNLDRLVDEGATAATSVRTLSFVPSSPEAYATLSAGTRVEVAASVDRALPAEARYEGSSAAAVAERRTGRTADGEVVVIGAAQVIANAGDDVSSTPGSLGQALRDSGRATAVIGSADERDFDGEPEPHRPAPLAAMDRAGAVTFGSVGNEVLASEPTAPFGIQADHDAIMGRLDRVLGQAGLVVIDPGDTDRAYSYQSLASDTQAEAQEQTALRRTDRLLGRVADRLPPEALLVVTGVTPPTSEWALTPTVLAGAGVVPGHLHSASTQRADLITVTDLTPTILDALGVEVPSGMIGQPLRYRPGDVDLGALRAADDLAGSREEIYFTIALTFIVVQAITYLLAIFFFTQGGGDRRVERILRTAVLSFAAWPVAGFLLRAVPPLMKLGTGSHLVLWLTSAAIALAAGRSRRHPLSPLAWISGLTVAVLLIDVGTGANLQMSSLLGYSPHTAARFTGYGNTTFAVLGATAVVLAAIHVTVAPRRREAIVAAAAMMVLVLVADGAPILGSDVGGILTLTPVFGLTLYVMSGRRLTARVVVITGVVTVALLATAIGVDLLRPPEDRTHLARFVVDSSSGDDTFFTTISRKWATNLRVLQGSIWTWMVPIIAVVMLYVLVLTKGWSRLLPPGSALRAGVVGTVAAGLIGWLVNDSGVVVAALVFVYLGPFLTLLTLDRLRQDAVRA